MSRQRCVAAVTGVDGSGASAPAPEPTTALQPDPVEVPAPVVAPPPEPEPAAPLPVAEMDSKRHRVNSAGKAKKKKGKMGKEKKKLAEQIKCDLFNGSYVRNPPRTSTVKQRRNETQEDDFQRNLEKAKAISLEQAVVGVPADELIALGISAAAELGIECTPPDLPLVNNCYVPKDGNCIQSSCSHANDPALKGDDLKQEAWELRVCGVGTTLERLKELTDEQISVLQGIISGPERETLSREQIRQEIELYQNNGMYEGHVGDILPQIAADHLNQPLLIIVVDDGQVVDTTWIEPGGLFGGSNQAEGFPIVLVREKQLLHFEPLLIPLRAKDMATEKYLQWKSSGRLGASVATVPSPTPTPSVETTPVVNHTTVPNTTPETVQEVAPTQPEENAGLKQDGSKEGQTELVWSDEVDSSCLPLEEVPKKSHDGWWSATSCDKPPVAPPVGIYYITRQWKSSCTLVQQLNQQPAFQEGAVTMSPAPAPEPTPAQEPAPAPVEATHTVPEPVATVPASDLDSVLHSRDRLNSAGDDLQQTVVPQPKCPVVQMQVNA